MDYRKRFGSEILGWCNIETFDLINHTMQYCSVRWLRELIRIGGITHVLGSSNKMLAC